MLGKKFTLLGLIVLAGAFSSSVVSAEELKVGILKSQLILNESVPAKAALQKLQAEFSKREKELVGMKSRLEAAGEKFEKDAPVMAESERLRRQRELSDMDREFQRKAREYNEDMNQRRNEESAAVLQRARRIVAEIGEKEKFDIILADESVAYFSKKIDITDKVMSALNK